MRAEVHAQRLSRCYSWRLCLATLVLKTLKN